jgi:peptidoglycan/LPS O-acetylase OafA/YrhL
LAAFVPPLACFLLGTSGKAVAAWVVPGLGPGAGWVGDWHSVLERSFFVQADLFAFGMALAVLRVEAEDGFLQLSRRWAVSLGLVGLLVALPTAILSDAGLLGSYQYDTLMALSCALFLALLVLRVDQPPDSGQPASRHPSRVLRILESRAFVTTGALSYSLFLWHEPVVRWMQSHGLTLGGRMGFVVDVALMGTVSWLLAAVTYRLVERPALDRKRDMRRSRIRLGPDSEPSAIEPRQ